MPGSINSHYFHILGDGHQPKSAGVYIPIIRIPIKGGMTIPNIGTFDHGTYKPIHRNCAYFYPCSRRPGEYLLRFGVLGMFFGSKYRTSGGVWMSRACVPLFLLSKSSTSICGSLTGKCSWNDAVALGGLE